MTERLKDRIEQYLTKKGQIMGMAELSLATGKSGQMIRRYLIGESVPNRETVFKLAKACGLNEAEALELAKEGTAQAKKRTA